MGSDDTDLVRPIEVVARRLSRMVGVVNGTLKAAPTRELASVASWVKRLRVGVLRDSQFPEILSDSTGTFRRPATWT